MNATLKAWCGLALLACYYLFAAVLVLFFTVLDAVTVAAAILPHQQSRPTVTTMLVAMGTIPVVAAIVLGVLGFGRRPPAPPSVRVPSGQAEPLWAAVRRASVSIGVGPPDELRLIPEVNANVSERSRWFGFAAGRRVMCVGLPLLIGLSDRQLDGVLCHELGHVAGGHTRFGLLVYRATRAQLDTVEALRPLFEANPLLRTCANSILLPFTLFRRIYLRLTREVSRRHELWADRMAARHARTDSSAPLGADFAEALCNLEPLAAAWSRLWAEVGEQTDTAAAPADLLRTFADLLNRPRFRATADLFQPTEDHLGGVYDTHPPLAVRLDELAREWTPFPGRLPFTAVVPQYVEELAPALTGVLVAASARDREGARRPAAADGASGAWRRRARIAAALPLLLTLGFLAPIVLLVAAGRVTTSNTPTPSAPPQRAIPVNPLLSTTYAPLTINGVRPAPRAPLVFPRASLVPLPTWLVVPPAGSSAP